MINIIGRNDEIEPNHVSLAKTFDFLEDISDARNDGDQHMESFRKVRNAVFEQEYHSGDIHTFYVEKLDELASDAETIDIIYNAQPTEFKVLERHLKEKLVIPASTVNQVMTIDLFGDREQQHAWSKATDSYVDWLFQNICDEDFDGCQVTHD
jgi:hypothetical protein